MPITLEDRRDFVENVVKLKLHLARQKALAGESLADVVTGRTNIYRLSDLWDGKRHPHRPPEGWCDARWDELTAALTALHERHADGATSETFEQAGLALLWPHLEPRLPDGVEKWPQLQTRPFGFFTCDAPKDSPEGPTIGIHLANPYAPQSPFKDMRARAGDLSRLLDDADTWEPAPSRIRCGSWLNSLPAFQALFPPEWLEGATSARPAYHYGWWGQFVNRTGAFNHKPGEHLRRTGEFLYPCIGCGCEIENLRQHLRETFGIESAG